MITVKRPFQIKPYFVIRRPWPWSLTYLAETVHLVFEIWSVRRKAFIFGMCVLASRYMNNPCGILTCQWKYRMRKKSVQHSHIRKTIPAPCGHVIFFKQFLTILIVGQLKTIYAKYNSKLASIFGQEDFLSFLHSFVRNSRPPPRFPGRVSTQCLARVSTQCHPYPYLTEVQSR